MEITSLLTLHRLAQRIADVHSTFEPNEHPPMDPEMEALNAEVNIQMFQHEIQEWRKSVPMSIRNLRTFNTGFYLLSPQFWPSSSAWTSSLVLVILVFSGRSNACYSFHWNSGTVSRLCHLQPRAGFSTTSVSRSSSLDGDQWTCKPRIP